MEPRRPRAVSPGGATYLLVLPPDPITAAMASVQHTAVWIQQMLTSRVRMRNKHAWMVKSPERMIVSPQQM